MATAIVQDLWDEEMEAEPPTEREFNDSSLGTSLGSETTSLRSEDLRGYMENGRRYQTIKEGPGQYPVPSDDKQFESMEAAHLVFMILDSEKPNALFRSPVGDRFQHVLDLGCGQGNWTIDVADAFPNTLVRGIDLFPTPQLVVPPNCVFQVDDMTKEFNFSVKFDLIHMRQLLCSFSYEEFDHVYKQAYDALVPGGWIEHMDSYINVLCDDGTLPHDSALAQYGDIIGPCCARSGNPADICDTMQQRIEAAGFVNIHVHDRKVPIGDWPRQRIYKDAGSCNKMHWLDGIEGWTTWLLTKFGAPKPWSMAEVRAWQEMVKKDLEAKYHVYTLSRRVWAQKPFEV